MKKLVLSLAIITLMFVFIPAQSEAVYGGKPATNEANAAAATVMINRLKEIDAMDKSSMNAPEKKALRKEVRKIKKELTVSGGGIYLSVGALLLVIILLIVLL